MDKPQHEPEIGKNILDVFFQRMYNNAKTVFREYIQNASDSLSEAYEHKITLKHDAAISIQIDRQQRKIVIHDNGIGIPVSQAEAKLLDVAKSTKNGETQAGQFGIGRLTGGSCCEKLSFKTSAKGEKYASEIIFDITKIRQIIANENDNSSAVSVIKQTTQCELHEEEPDQHYFTVTLENVNNDELLDIESVKQYLQQVAPLDFNVPFKTKLLSSVPEEFKTDIEQLRHFPIFINDELLHKPYGLKISGTGDEILRLECFRIADFAWGWFAVTRFTKAIKKDDQNRGLRLRKHNIMIGDANFLNDFFRQDRSNNYFYGEIHVTNKVKLTADRDNLYPNSDNENFKSELNNKWIELEQLYQHANEIKKATERGTLTDSETKRFNKRTKNSDAFRTIYNDYTKDLPKPTPQQESTVPQPTPESQHKTPNQQPRTPNPQPKTPEPQPNSQPPTDKPTLTEQIDRLNNYSPEQKALIKNIFSCIKKRLPQTSITEMDRIMNQVIEKDL